MIHVLPARVTFSPPVSNLRPPLSFEPWGVLERYLDTIFLFAIQEDYINAKMAKSELDCNDV